MKRNLKLQHYTDILEKMKTYFPSPVSNPIMDGYLVHTISNFLDHVDNLKCTAPILVIEQDLECTFHNVDKERLPILPRIKLETCLLYTSPSPRDGLLSRMPSSA